MAILRQDGRFEFRLVLPTVEQHRTPLAEACKPVTEKTVPRSNQTWPN